MTQIGKPLIANAYMTLHDCTSTYANILNVDKLVVVDNTTCSRCHVCQALTKSTWAQVSKRFHYRLLILWSTGSVGL
jgi:hypothetical protein